jgi:hypothetical protein
MREPLGRRKTTLLLYRPVGLHELELIAAAGCRAFPPRLPHQPIFYPVLNLEYAEQIARDWNTVDPASGFAGFVTQFEVADAYVAQFEVHVVGGPVHRELWVPAEELAAFNTNIQRRIQVVRAFYGAAATVAVDRVSHLPRALAAAFAAA